MLSRMQHDRCHSRGGCRVDLGSTLGWVMFQKSLTLDKTVSIMKGSAAPCEAAVRSSSSPDQKVSAMLPQLGSLHPSPAPHAPGACQLCCRL
jgi:hypothetical protein